MVVRRTSSAPPWVLRKRTRRHAPPTTISAEGEAARRVLVPVFTGFPYSRVQQASHSAGPWCRTPLLPLAREPLRQPLQLPQVVGVVLPPCGGGASTGGGAGTGGDGSSSQREATPDEFVFRRDFPPGDCIPNFWGSEEEAESLQPGVGGGNRGERSAGVGDVGGDGQRLGGGADDGSRRRRFADFRLKDCPALAHGTVPPQASGHSRRW